jgi:signal transduction protein with GAF and PtsI domain
MEATMTTSARQKVAYTIIAIAIEMIDKRCGVYYTLTEILDNATKECEHRIFSNSVKIKWRKLLPGLSTELDRSLSVSDNGKHPRGTYLHNVLLNVDEYL